MAEEGNLRWGIVSTAKIAADWVRSLRLFYPSATVVAISSRTLEAATAFAEEHNIPKAYGSHTELFADPDVDAIYVTTLNPFHKNPVVDALRAGKHVLCEKPFCMNAREAREMIQVAREEKKFLMEAMWTRYFPAFIKMREIISSGKIGKVLSLRGQFGFELGGRDVARLTQLDLGGGALMDIGIYLLSFSHAVFGSVYPNEVRALAKFEGKVDWHTTVLLGYESGQAVLDFGFDSAFYETQVFIVGEKGKISVCHPFFAPEKIIVNTAEGEEVINFPVPPNNVKWNFSQSASLYHEVQYMQEAIKAGKLESEHLPLDESLQILTLTDAIRFQIGLLYPWDQVELEL